MATKIGNYSPSSFWSHYFEEKKSQILWPSHNIWTLSPPPLSFPHYAGAGCTWRYSKGVLEILPLKFRPTRLQCRATSTGIWSKALCFIPDMYKGASVRAWLVRFVDEVGKTMMMNGQNSQWPYNTFIHILSILYIHNGAKHFLNYSRNWQNPLISIFLDVQYSIF